MSKIRIQCNVEREIVEKADAYLHEMGLTRTSAINMLFHQIANTGQFPFTPSVDGDEDHLNLDNDEIPYVAVSANEPKSEWLAKLEQKK